MIIFITIIWNIILKLSTTFSSWQRRIIFTDNGDNNVLDSSEEQCIDLCFNLAFRPGESHFSELVIK